MLQHGALTEQYCASGAAHLGLGQLEAVAVEAGAAQQLEERGEDQRVVHRHRQLNVPKVARAGHVALLAGAALPRLLQGAHSRIVQAARHRISQVVEHDRAHDLLHAQLPDLRGGGTNRYLN
jgi:hypothetical protein